MIMLFFLIINFKINSQALPQLAPPAPNAAALAQYADIPVSKYTGVPNTSIPLYTIKSSDFELPITLSYHASGIKASQEASSAGLGWVLNAGGVITRQIRGLDDFLTAGEKKGFLTSAPLPAFGTCYGIYGCGGLYNPPTSHISPFIRSSCGSAISVGGNIYIESVDVCSTDYIGDTESDLYSFNFGSYSGKFVINKDGSTVLLSPESGIIIKVINTNSWQATTPDGVIYKFTRKEYTTPYSFTSGQFNDSLFWAKGGSASSQYISSWYLSDILLTNGENITFYYDSLNTESWSYGPVIVRRAEAVPGHVLSGAESARMNAFNLQYSKSSSQNNSECYLRAIMWNEGSVNLTYADRSDIDASGGIRSKRIDKISIKKLDGSLLYNTDGTEISRIQFYHSYFNSQDLGSTLNFLSLRLKLDSFTIDDKTYSFTYLNPNALPKKYSNSTDHWGYYNNEANLSGVMQGGYNVPYIIPKAVVSNPAFFPQPKFYEGATRDSNPTVLTNGMLFSIQYPTKGLVTFEYEPNEFELMLNPNSSSCGLLKYDDYFNDQTYSVTNPAVASVCTGCFVPGTNPTFTLTQTTRVKFEFQYSPYGSQTPSVPVNGSGAGVVFGSITRTDPGGSFSKTYFYVPGTPGKVFNDEFDLPAGTYRISTVPAYSFTTKGIARYSSPKTLASSKRITGGGVRIKKIISEQNTREFYYNQENDATKTSGLLIIEPSYAYFSTELFYTMLSLVRESSPVHALSDSGTTVGYSFVRESISDGINSSSVTSKFKNNIEFRSEGSNMPLNIAFDNGLLLEESYLTNNRVISKKTYTYENAFFKRYELYNTYFLRLNFSFGGFSSHNYYRVTPEWWRLNSEVKQDYFHDASGNQSIVSSQRDYEYNIYNYKTNKITTKNSREQFVIQKITYPVDYNSSVYTDMVSRNVTTLPVESLTITDGKITQAKLNTYQSVQIYPDGEVQLRDVPLAVYSFNSINSPIESAFSRYDGITIGQGFKKELQYDSYNLRGEPLQITENGAKIHTYLWGYNQNHLIAKIENATYNQVSALPGFSGVIPQGLSAAQDAQLRSGLPDAMVTTYSYLPLIGISSITDPKADKTTFSYDLWGRLQAVKDKNGFFISEYNYNYKP